MISPCSPFKFLVHRVALFPSILKLTNARTQNESTPIMATDANLWEWPNKGKKRNQYRLNGESIQPLPIGDLEPPKYLLWTQDGKWCTTNIYADRILRVWRQGREDCIGCPFCARGWRRIQSSLPSLEMISWWPSLAGILNCQSWSCHKLEAIKIHLLTISISNWWDEMRNTLQIGNSPFNFLVLTVRWDLAGIPFHQCEQMIPPISWTCFCG